MATAIRFVVPFAVMMLAASVAFYWPVHDAKLGPLSRLLLRESVRRFAERELAGK